MTAGSLSGDRRRRAVMTAGGRGASAVGAVR
jgi:hypothetical protein